jgi:hypothetical protein
MPLTKVILYQESDGSIPLRDWLDRLQVEARDRCLRILDFFHDRVAAVVSHGFAKEGKIPSKEIRLATERMNKFRANPKKHTPNDQENSDE